MTVMHNRSHFEQRPGILRRLDGREQPHHRGLGGYRFFSSNGPARTRLENGTKEGSGGASNSDAEVMEKVHRLVCNRDPSVMGGDAVTVAVDIAVCLWRQGRLCC